MASQLQAGCQDQVPDHWTSCEQWLCSPMMAGGSGETEVIVGNLVHVVSDHVVCDHVVSDHPESATDPRLGDPSFPSCPWSDPQ
mmetsp:Transcript_51463/g.122387  ORF Transcript_51463/g.122387 Transcript_51463/m.122387 type:complete len:84 (-) Transcript_51463:546-797(-)